MKKMDSYKANVIKADAIIDSGKPVSLFHIFSDEKVSSPDLPQPPASEQTHQDKLQSEMKAKLSLVSDESYKKGFADAMAAQQKASAPILEAIAAMTEMIPVIRKDILEKQQEETVKLAIAIAEKILNREVSTHKEVILGVLKTVMKNIAETDGMKIRLHQQDFRYMMEVKKDFLQSFDGVRNVVFEEDASVKRGGALVETMFGEVDARLESQLEEIKKAMLKL